jgi:hypothetical protein
VALYDRYLERRNHEDFRAGVIAATIANFSMGRDDDKPPFEPHDFFGHLPKPKEQPMSDEAIFDFLSSIATNKPN